MTPVEKNSKVSVEAYFAYEDSIPWKAEYFHGEIVDMAGGSENHSLITANLIRRVGEATDGNPCRVYDCNFKVELSENDLYAYPDVMVVCGETERSKLRNDICINPTMVIEVISESTRSKDQGIKQFWYRSLASLQEFWIVEQDRPLVFAHYRNDEGQWMSDAYGDISDEVVVHSMGVKIPMSKIYANVTFHD